MVDTGKHGMDIDELRTALKAWIQRRARKTKSPDLSYNDARKDRLATVPLGIREVSETAHSCVRTSLCFCEPPQGSAVVFREDVGI